MKLEQLVLLTLKFIENRLLAGNQLYPGCPFNGGNVPYTQVIV